MLVAEHGVNPVLQFEHFLQQALRLDAAPMGFGPKHLELFTQARPVTEASAVRMGNDFPARISRARDAPAELGHCI